MSTVQSKSCTSLKNEFDNLPYGDDYNFRDGLTDNLSFVFEPPGTGKTTRLAEIIRHKMELDSCRILVLAPTNKACDVLTRKPIETSKDGYGWLGRFVATGEEFIESLRCSYRPCKRSIHKRQMLCCFYYCQTPL